MGGRPADLRRAEEAADALQDALVSAFRRAETFRGEAAVTTWLHRIVVNACLDRIRRRRARPTVGLPDPAEPGALPAAATTPDPAGDAVTRLDVEAALTALPADQRAAIVLVDLQGYPVADAAEVLGVPVGTVKSRCARGRVRLAPLLAHLVGQGTAGEAGSVTRAAGRPAGPATHPTRREAT